MISLRLFSSEGHILEGFLQLIDQFGRDAGEIVDEIERVLDLVRDTGGELTKRGELLRLHQAVLCGAQVLQRFRQFAGAGFHAFKQPHVLDRNRGLVGERSQELDLFVGERPRLRTGQCQYAHRDALAHERDT